MGRFVIARQIAPIALAALALAAVCAAVAVAAGAGSLDPSFSSDGKRLVRFGQYADNGYAVDVQPSGKLVLAGASIRSGANYDWAIARLLPGGGLDSSFSGDGKRFLSFDNGSNESAWDLAAQAGGKVVVVGSAGTAGGLDFAIVRLRSNGGLDTSFSGDGRRTFGFANGTRPDQARGVGIQPDGRIVVAGDSYDQGIDSNIGVARLKPGGSFDDSFSGDGKRLVRFDPASGGDSPQDLAIQPDGRIVIAGYSGVSSNQAIGIVRLLPNGKPDPSFSGDGRRLVRFDNGTTYGDTGFAVALAPGGRIVVAGNTYNSGGGSFAVVRLLSNGNLDHSFSGNGLRAVSFGPTSNGASGRAVAVRGDGRIVVAGSSSPGIMQQEFAIAQLLPNGDLDHSFAGDGKRLLRFGQPPGDSAYGVALAPGGGVVVAGSSTAPGDQDFAVARLLGP